MNNRTAVLDAFRKRWEAVALGLQGAKNDAKEEFAGLVMEMKGHDLGISAEEIAGVKLTVKRALESDEKHKKRQAIEAIADELGQYLLGV